MTDGLKLDPSTELGFALKRKVPGGLAFIDWALDDGYTELCSGCGGNGIITTVEVARSDDSVERIEHRSECDSCAGTGAEPIAGPGIVAICDAFLQQGWDWGEIETAFFVMSNRLWAPSLSLLQSHYREQAA